MCMTRDCIMSLRGVQAVWDAAKETGYLHMKVYEKDDQEEPIHRAQPSGSTGPARGTRVRGENWLNW